MKTRVLLGIVLITLSTPFAIAARHKTREVRQIRDTLNYTEINARVIDQTNGEPVVFATVFQTGENIGTVTNIDGEFVLKIPRDSQKRSISINHLGYKNTEITMEALKASDYQIALTPYSIPLEELVVTHADPKALIEKAILLKKTNYSTLPEMQTGFYRETIKQNRNYVAISEAILDIYNSGYSENFDFDRVKIYKGRRSKNVKNMDTVLIKFQGGPRIAMFLDLVKNPGVILNPEMFPYYNYTLDGVVKVSDRNNFVVGFDQRLDSEYPLYQGKVYIDMETYAITGIDFKMSQKSLDNAPNLLIKKKPASMDIDFLNGTYRVNYREINGKWVLNYVRSELAFRVKWDKKLFKSNINTMFEMAITDRDPENIEQFPYKETTKLNDVLNEQVEDEGNGDYWGEYNYIKPDESIESAIQKLNKKSTTH